MRGKTSPENTNRVTYSIEYLARLAMSPLCLVLPNDWERISNEYPALVRKVSAIKIFNSFVSLVLFIFSPGVNDFELKNLIQKVIWA